MGVFVTAIIILVSVCAIVAVIVLVGRIRDILSQRKRTRAILHQIDGKSFRFHRSYQVGCYDLMASVHERLREAGMRNLCFTFQNVLTCKRTGVKWLIFDAGYGRKLKKRSRFVATYFQAEVPESLPAFTVTLKHKDSAPGDQLAFKDHAFMKRYSVRSDDDTTGKLFTLELQTLMLHQRPPFSMQAGKHLLQFHLPIKDAPPEKLLDLFASAENICTMLRSNTFL